MHVQPWWYYLPVLAVLLLPWTPLVGLLMERAAYHDPRRAFLLGWIVFGLVFFSLAANKLPGYVLPVLPAFAALVGVTLQETAGTRWWLAACALLLAVFPVAAQVGPEGLATGLFHASRPVFQGTWVAPLAVAAMAWLLDGRGRRLAAVFCIAAGAAAGVVYLTGTTAPELDRLASARRLWESIRAVGQGPAPLVCVGDLQRNWLYGLNYYAGSPLPSCSERITPWQVLQAPGEPPHIAHIAPHIGSAVDPPTSGIVISPFQD